MNRRRFLGGCAALWSSLAVAGCTGGDGDSDGEDGSGVTPTRTDTPDATPTPESTASSEGTATPDPARGIYVQTFRETMSMQGTATSGRYRFALMFAVPHDFWTVTGDEFSLTAAQPDDSLHLMAVPWDAETRTVLPETGLSVEVTRDGDLVSEEVIYPMLSQPMGFHYGGNFALDGDGTYTVTVSVGGTTIRQTGDFAGQFGDPATVEIPLEFTQESRDEVQSRPIDQGGDPGALRPMEMMDVPQSVLPAPEELPGTVRGQATTDDARLVVATLPEPPAGVESPGPYLAVSARTRYNGYVVPAMALDATLTRDGSTVFDGSTERTLDPDLGYHYGAAVEDVAPGDELTLSTQTIPPVARHEGYETALRRMGDVSVTL
jgi:hypothetical protein